MSNLDQEYFLWLYGQVGALHDRNPKHTYELLCEQLHKTTFIWTVHNDDNRALDGTVLREEFVNETGLSRDSSHIRGRCSVLEMMLALARRAAYESVGLGIFGGADEWFFGMLQNTGLSYYNDSKYAFDPNAPADVEDILDYVMRRKYDWTGDGSFFPMHSPSGDMRSTELWMQLNQYILENSDIGR